MSLSPAQKYLQDFCKLAQVRRWQQRDDVLRSMEALHSRLDPNSREAIVLGFALAKICDDLGETDQCFALLQESNRRHRAGKTDTIENARATVAAVKRLFSSQAIEALPPTRGQQVLFIVGMPRSGTTLVEQILCSHSSVHGGGELKLMGQWCHGFLELYLSDPERIRLQDYLPQLEAHYRRGLRELTNAAVVTDKMPVNFLWLGFLCQAFPEARIIHTRRDAMATCWSIFKTPFLGTSNGYACDLADIGEFYRLYSELMAFWRQQLPGRIFDLDYEALTRQQETRTRELLAHCGLEFEPACLEFHNNPRQVRTASAHQVIRPMYQGSSQAWKPYESHLTPLIETLALS